MLTRDSTEPADPGVSHHWRTGWSHDWRKGGPITLAERLPSAPMPLAGDTPEPSALRTVGRAPGRSGRPRSPSTTAPAISALAMITCSGVPARRWSPRGPFGLVVLAHRWWSPSRSRVTWWSRDTSQRAGIERGPPPQLPRLPGQSPRRRLPRRRYYGTVADGPGPSDIDLCTFVFGCRFAPASFVTMVGWVVGTRSERKGGRYGEVRVRVQGWLEADERG